MKKDFLKILIEQKKEEVAAAQKQVPESALREKALAPAERRPFFTKLKKPGPSGVNIIAEIKRASPSRGLICPDLNPALLAHAYEAGGAAALSVLTEQKYFQGSFNDFTAARAATTLPVLRKDFLFTAYQLYESAVLGADAVLLIARILSKNQLRDYVLLCEELHLDALVEVHSKEDLAAATGAGAKLIGINNRNLSSFKTDIKTAIRLAAFLQPDQIPVAASGIQGRQDIEKNLKIGIKNFLIGESLIKAENPAALLKSLMGQTC